MRFLDIYKTKYQALGTKIIVRQNQNIKTNKNYEIQCLTTLCIINQRMPYCEVNRLWGTN